MELGRWGVATLTQISDRYRDFSRFLTEVLEGDRSLLSGSEHSDSLFSVRDDLESLRQKKLAQKTAAKSREGECFLRLAPFFEAGFMLHQMADNSAGSGASAATAVSLRSMFLFGKTFFPPADEAPNLELSLPAFFAGRVYRSRIEPVLRVFRLENLSSLKSAGAFAFSPRQGLVFVLICNRPNPWQSSAIETAYMSCLELATAKSSESSPGFSR